MNHKPPQSLSPTPSTMASLLLFFLLYLPLFTTTTSTSPPSPIIEKTCNATTFYSFCISSLSSSTTTSSTPTVQSLSSTLITLAIANATSTSSFASSLATKTPPLSSLLTTCANKYMHARESLQAAQDSLSNEEYDYAFVSVSAAQEYPKVCRVLFRQAKKEYPKEMAKREEVLERLCTVGLEIISTLVDGGGNDASKLN